MALLLIVGAVVTIILIYVWDYFSSGGRLMRQMPAIGNPRELPLIGRAHVMALRPLTELLPLMDSFALEFPRLIKYRIFNTVYVYSRNPNDLEVVLSSMNYITKGIDYEYSKPWLRDGLIVSNGKKWKQRRKLLTPAFHYKILENSLPILHKHAVKLVRNLLAEGSRPLVLEDHIGAYTLDVICETAMGVPLNCLDNEAGEYLRAIRSVTRTMMNKIVYLWLHPDWLFKMSPSGREFYKKLRILHSFTQKVIAERRNEYKNKVLIPETVGIYERKKAFLDCLIELDLANPGLLSSSDIQEEVDTFMFEGHDTTAAAITFAMFLLATHPQHQEKTAAEQESIFGEDRERAATMQDLQAMVYLELVLKETLRLYPSVPFISRLLLQDVVFKDGVRLPAGVNYFVSPYLLHRNSDFWEDPEKFIPERFAEKPKHPFAYIPFSAGPRNCIGQKLAMIELKSVLSWIVRHCRVGQVTTGEEVGHVPLIILRPEPPIRITISPRVHSSQLSL